LPISRYPSVDSLKTFGGQGNGASTKS
jgi:hypothetical protein